MRSGSVRCATAWMPDPSRGSIWTVDLGDPIGHESGVRRPALAISVDSFNAHGLVTVCPVTTTALPYPTRVELGPATSDLRDTCYVQVEQLQTISTGRLVERVGGVDVLVTTRVERVLRYLLGLTS